MTSSRTRALIVQITTNILTNYYLSTLSVDINNSLIRNPNAEPTKQKLAIMLFTATLYLETTESLIILQTRLVLSPFTIDINVCPTNNELWWKLVNNLSPFPSCNMSYPMMMDFLVGSFSIKQLVNGLLMIQMNA